MNIGAHSREAYEGWGETANRAYATSMSIIPAAITKAPARATNFRESRPEVIVVSPQDMAARLKLRYRIIDCLGCPRDTLPK
jgi:hypothetical protein